MIRCNNLSVGYHREKVISGINLEFHEGEVLAVLGPNGCGKSTLLRAVLGILKPMEGDVWYDDLSIKGMTEKEIARKASFLTQSRDTPDILVKRLVLHGRFPWMGIPRRYTKRDMEIADRAMEYTGCVELADRMMSDLSGGQRQAVYLAMLLAQDTKAVFMDEPTTYLDVQNQFQLLKAAKKIAGQGKAVTFILHDLTLALQYADKIAVMDKGQLVFYGTPKEVVASGCIEAIFRVRLRKVMLDEREYYLCEPL